MKQPEKLIVPVFIPHFGCAHRCVFCDQNGITGREGPPGPDEVAVYLSEHLNQDTHDAVIAFYGGSFTCLPLSVQDGFLTAASVFIGRGHAASIRLSTRPDCIDDAAASHLRSRGVGVVELGAQSMDDAVLKASARGHSASDTVRAAGLVKAAGLELGIQIMAGLPGDTQEGFIRTVDKVIALRPSFVRIYPVLVVKGAPLEKLYLRGKYVPLTLEEAVSLCADAHAAFDEAGIRVIRTGLQPSESLEAALVAGPYHPSFGHLVRSELALRKMRALIGKANVSGQLKEVVIAVNPAELSTYLGIGKHNLDALSREYGPGISIKPDAAVCKGGLELR